MTEPHFRPTTKVGMLKSLIRLIRPSQWIKNLFVFAPVLFGGALLDTRALLAGLVAFLAFCFAASSIYCFNDIHDVADDRRHPEKCQRPIASGAISVAQAYGVMAVMIALGVAVTFLLPLIGPWHPPTGWPSTCPPCPNGAA